MDFSRRGKRKATFDSDVEYDDDSEQEEVGNSSSEGEDSDEVMSFNYVGRSVNDQNGGKSKSNTKKMRDSNDPVSFVASSSSSSPSAPNSNDAAHSSNAERKSAGAPDNETGAWQKHTKGIEVMLISG